MLLCLSGFGQGKYPIDGRLQLPVGKERRSAQQPDNANLGGSLAESRSYLGLAFQRMNEPGRAIEILRLSTEELAQRIQLNPRDEHLTFVLLNSRNELADVLLSQGDIAGAQEQTRLALMLYQDWPEVTRKNTMHLHSAAQTRFVAGLAAAAADGNRPGRTACEHFREARELLKAIPGELPSSSDGQLSRQDVETQLAACGAA